MTFKKYTSSYETAWRTHHAISVGASNNANNTRYGIDFLDEHRFYYGQPGYYNNDNPAKRYGRLTLYNLENINSYSHETAHDLSPEDDLTDNARFGQVFPLMEIFLQLLHLLMKKLEMTLVVCLFIKKMQMVIL